MKNFKILMLVMFIGGCSSIPEGSVVMNSKEYDELLFMSFTAGWDRAVDKVKSCKKYTIKEGVAYEY